MVWFRQKLVDFGIGSGRYVVGYGRQRVRAFVELGDQHPWAGRIEPHARSALV